MHMANAILIFPLMAIWLGTQYKIVSYFRTLKMTKKNKTNKHAFCITIPIVHK